MHPIPFFGYLCAYTKVHTYTLVGKGTLTSTWEERRKKKRRESIEKAFSLTYNTRNRWFLFEVKCLAGRLLAIMKKLKFDFDVELDLAIYAYALVPRICFSRVLK